MSQTFVVVGAGLTAAKTVEELRGSGFDGQIVVYGAEHHLPYERPPLSKAYLLGHEEIDKAFVHAPDWYDENDVDLRLGTTVAGLDLSARTVHAGGSTQHYDRLLLATGSSPRHLTMADDSGAPVVYLRTIEDSDRLKNALGERRRIAVVGGGWIGLEVASAARQADCEVTVLEALDLPLLRVLGPEVAQVFARLHRSHGVDLRTRTDITAVEHGDGHAVVHLGDGTSVEADLLVVGVGVLPNTGLAEAAGLKTDNGIVVDDRLRSSDPDVFAAGDVANAQHALLDTSIRVEHWDNAIEQGKLVAHSMLGHDLRYTHLPYFFTDQYDLGMEYVGHVGSDGYDEVVLRGDEEGYVFNAFWMREGTVLAGMHVNDWDAIDPIRGLVGAKVDAERLRDGSSSLAEVARG